MVIVAFFVAHWTLSVFFQTFFLHRYAAHRMYKLSPFWERVFYFASFVFMGPSFLTPKDPHSPRNHSGLFTMMAATRKTYHDLAHGIVAPDPKFDGGYPEWKALDRFSQSWLVRIGFGAGYTLVYFAFATHAWMFALLPIHYLMGPVHGAIVNWCGHRYGYRSFDNGDDSRNTLAFDFLTLGELFQNNHHKFGMSPNFAARWFEIDPTWQVMRVLGWIGVIDLGARPQIARPPARAIAGAPMEPDAPVSPAE